MGFPSSVASLTLRNLIRAGFSPHTLRTFSLQTPNSPLRSPFTTWDSDGVPFFCCFACAAQPHQGRLLTPCPSNLIFFPTPNSPLRSPFTTRDSDGVPFFCCFACAAQPHQGRLLTPCPSNLIFFPTPNSLLRSPLLLGIVMGFEPTTLRTTI